MIGTVDLPAHNAYVEPTEDLVSVIGGEGLETLVSNDTTSYIRFDKDPSSTGGNGWAFRVGRGGTMLGFGLWDPDPAGSHPDAVATAAFAGEVTDVRFVMRARLPFGGGGDIPYDGGGSYGDGAYPPGYTNLPVHRWPMVMLTYAGADYEVPSGYNFSAIRTDGQWDDLICDVPLKHLIGGVDYVIADTGSPAVGLCPRVFIDANYPWPNVPFVNNVAVDIAYLAIRVTYQRTDEPAPLRIYPRNRTRIHPRRRTRRPGTF